MRVVVVSPHCDDAVLSIGGYLNGLERRGIDVVVVTIFGGDPDASTPSSYWDLDRGATQGEAAAQRWREDKAALGRLGATSIVLPFADNGYTGRRDPDEIWAALGTTIDAADVVLLPGWPLEHADHAYATMLVLERLDDNTAVVFYAEQPYASVLVKLLKSVIRGRTSAALAHGYPGPIVWQSVRIDRADRTAQRHAQSEYSGELSKLGVRLRLAALTRRVFGEWLGVGSQASPPRLPGLQ